MVANIFHQWNIYVDRLVTALNEKEIVEINLIKYINISTYNILLQYQQF